MADPLFSFQKRKPEFLYDITFSFFQYQITNFYTKANAGYGDNKRKEPDMADKNMMTPEEKALLQAKHRLEEAEARDRVKERKARTRRLIQEGAVLESVVPHVTAMELDDLKRELLIRLQGM